MDCCEYCNESLGSINNLNLLIGERLLVLKKGLNYVHVSRHFRILQNEGHCVETDTIQRTVSFVFFV